MKKTIIFLIVVLTGFTFHISNFEADAQFSIGSAPVDNDGDGIPDTDDNCPDDANRDQKDSDGDGIGDACDTPELTSVPVDNDDDGIPDADDNCPDDANRDQKDSDGDGIGNVCDVPEALPELPPTKPDLIIESITHSPDNPDTDDLITFKAVVKNIGLIGAGKSTLEFRIGGETSGPENRFDVPALAPGKTFTETRQATFNEAKNYGNTAIADVFDVVDELDEDNNKKTDVYEVKEAREPEEPDGERPDTGAQIPEPDDEVLVISSRSIEEIESEDETEDEQLQIRPIVPTWVQTTAKFWVDGDVEDKDFTGGIGYLLQERIIDLEDEIVEETPPKEQKTASESVPKWIMQTTQWWINGEVPEDQFLEGIKWLVQNRIILVAQKIETDPELEEFEPVDASNLYTKAASTMEPRDADLPINDPNKYIGVWRAGNYGHFLWIGDTWDGFINKGTELASDGFHLIDMERSSKDGKNRYNGVWKKASGANLLVSGKPWDEFLEDGKEKVTQGYRLIDVERFVKNNKGHYNGVWVSGSDSNFVVAGKTWDNFKDEVNDNAKDNLRLVDLESYTSGGQQKFLGVYRSGSYDYGIQSPMSWKDFVEGWKIFSDTDRRLVDIERFAQDGKIKYAGLYEEGSDSYRLWYAADREEFVSKWREYTDKGLRLVDLELFPNQCKMQCLNDVVRPEGGQYRTSNPKTDLHCNGPPSTCYPYPSPDEFVRYRAPVDVIGEQTYVRLSVIDDGDQIFSLPVRNMDVELSQTWIYKSGNYHHAEDYSSPNGDSFEIHAAAPGKVIYVDYRWWSGNTVIISHDVGGKEDVYRTIYRHLQNGPINDCSMAWNESVTNKDFDDEKLEKYKDYLEFSDCKKAGDLPDKKYWGSIEKKMVVSADQEVDRGDLLGWAGNTGPGGIILSIDEKNIEDTGRNIHLHITFAKRDPVDDQWYIIDPYGIYSKRDCYPSELDDPINTPCSRYQVFWKGGVAQYP